MQKIELKMFQYRHPNKTPLPHNQNFGGGAHSEHFYIRASNCQSRHTEFLDHTGWTDTMIGGIECSVASFKLDSMLP